MKVHLIGLGGIGMSGLARLLIAQGDRICGSDVKDSPLLKEIRRLGGEVQVGHSALFLNHPDVVVYSTSIAPDNPELLAARNRGIPVLHRGQMVAKLTRPFKTVAVTGAHGKSTTTAMAAELLLRAGLDPTALLGAEVQRLGGNARLGRGPYAVVEADESDGSLLWLKPFVAILTNMDEEHLDYFRNRWEIRALYAAFAQQVRPEGALIGCADDHEIRRLMKGIGCRKVTYGLSPEAEVTAGGIELIAGGSRYRCWRGGRKVGDFRLQVPGLHNVVNSLSVVALGQLLGIDVRTIREALADYQGAKRRFQIEGEARGVLVVEDYAHHPVEIEATLQAAGSWGAKRVRVVFQPHRYSRTRFLMERFGASFRQAQEVVLLPIYAASEEPVEGVSAEALACAVRAACPGKRVSVRSPEESLEYLQTTARPGDLVLFLGAGSIGGLAGEFLKQLKKPEA